MDVLEDRAHSLEVRRDGSYEVRAENYLGEEIIEIVRGLQDHRPAFYLFAAAKGILCE